MSEGGSGRWAWAVPVALAVATFAIGVGNDFVLDDGPAIVRNPVVTGDVPALEAFTRNFWGAPAGEPPASYRPLVVLSFVLDRALFGLDPIAFHVMSLLYYCLAVELVRRLARVWLPDRASVLAACLFATAPVHAEVVASLVGRADVFAWIGTAVSLLALQPMLHTDEVRGPVGPARLAVSAIGYAFALLSKESAALLPVVVWLCIEFTEPDRTWSPADLIRRWRTPLVLAVVGLLYLWIRHAVLGEIAGGYFIPDDVMASASGGQRVEYSLGLLGRYFGLLAAPFDLCTGRKYAEVWRPSSMFELPTVAGLVLVVGIGWAATRAFRRRRPPLLLAALASWLVFSSLLFSVPEAMADRFATIPSAFVALAVAGPLAAWSGQAKTRWGLVGLLIAIQAGLSAFYATRWSNTSTLLEHAVIACPASVHNQYRFGRHLAELGQHEEAVWHLAVASEGRRHFPERWEHPAPDATLELPAAERLARMHALLQVDLPEAQWRLALANYLARLGLQTEAELVVRSSPVPLRPEGT
jgi:hypothetical protein